MSQLKNAPRILFDRKLSLGIFLFLLFAVAFVVRVWGMSKCHFWDEMVYLQNAQVIAFGKTNYSELSYRPPLLSLIFAGVFLVWHHIYAACIVTAMINALGAVFLYLAGRLSVGRLPAAIAAILLALAPFFVGVFPAAFDSDDTGNSLLTDSPALTLVLLALWLLLRALRHPTTFRFASAGFVLALSILMRFGSMPSVGMLFLLTLLAPRRGRAMLACAAGLGVGMAPYLLWSRLEYGGFLYTLKAGWTNVEGPSESFFYYLKNSCTIFSTVAMTGLLIMAVYGLFRLLQTRDLPARFRAALSSGATPEVLQAYLWLWLLVAFVFFSKMPHKEPRYVLPLAPPLLLLAGCGLALLCTLPRKPLRIAGSLLVAASLLLTFLPLRERLSGPFVSENVPEEMLASNFLQARFPPRTMLYMNFNYPAFAYFTSYRIYELPAVGPKLYEDLEKMPAGEILIAYRRTEGGEPRVEWLDANPKFEKLKEFSTMTVYRRRADAVR